MVFRGWLIFYDVKRRTGNLSMLQRAPESVFVDDAAAGGIDQVRRSLHQRESPLIDHSIGLGCQRAVNRDDIGFRQQLIQSHPLATQGGDMRFGNIRIVNETIHFERQRPERHSRADIAHTDNAKGFFSQLRSDELKVLAPTIFFYSLIRLEGVTH